MKIDVLTLFPGILRGPLQESILARAQKKRLVSIKTHNIRDFAQGRHRVTDDRPYGGGPGMVMKPEPVVKAVEHVRKKGCHVVLMSPTGKRFDQKAAERLRRKKHLIFVCGHYEGFDQRIHDLVADEEISIGDYVLTNGALAAMVVVDAVVRLIPGVVGDEASVQQESFSTGILDHPHYTRPPSFRGKSVPDVLLGGNHNRIERWREQEALRRTKKMRGDLISKDNV
jgi:tRNA (guanine37-N1)-methyltransferase